MKHKNKDLHKLVFKHMMHGPCGEYNSQNICMKNGKFTNHYPKQFSDYTKHNEDSYPCYR